MIGHYSLFPTTFEFLNSISDRKSLLTVVLWEKWNILEIEKMKNCSKVQFYMGKINFRSKCVYVSWLLRYSAFSILTKISWLIFLPRLHKNWAWLNISETICGFGLIHTFQKWFNFWKSVIQQLTYKQNTVWLEIELYKFPRNFLNFRLIFCHYFGQNFNIQL